jgi:AcrR family transcriptional regulator
VPVSQKRIRRTPDEARALILDAAEKVSRVQGPAGLRLQDVAREAGVSHPTILHHFGNREGLMRALNGHVLAQLTQEIIQGMTAAGSGKDGVSRTFAVYRNGVAERLVWTALSGAVMAGEPPQFFDQVVQSLQAVRRSFARPGEEPDIGETRHVVHLTIVAAIGDALLGQRLRQAEDHEDDARGAFEGFLSEMIREYLESRI